MAFFVVPYWAYSQSHSLEFSSYIGGSGYEQVRDIATDDSGNVYITGGTSSVNFTTTLNAYGRRLNQDGEKIMDAFVMKFQSNGKLIWSTLLGGPEYDRAYAIEVDPKGYVYIAGRAGQGIPTTSSSFQPSFGGDTNINPLYGAQDGFIAKISPNGSELVWCSYFGAEDKGFIRDIALDSHGNVYLVETEASADCRHVRPGAPQTKRNGRYDGVIAKIAGDGRSVKWATYLGGSGDDLIGPSIRINSRQEVVVCGMTTSSDMPVTQTAFDQNYNGLEDMFIAMINNEGTRFLLGTYLGGKGSDGGETHNLALDNEDNIVVAATTSSTDFPVTKGAYQITYGGTGSRGTGLHTNYPFDGFIAKLSADGSQLLAATYLGGSAGEGLEGVATEADGKIYCGGSSFSNNIPATPNSFQSINKGKADQLVACFSSDLSKLLYFTYLGGEDIDYGRTLYADKHGNVYIGGETVSKSYPAKTEFKGGNLDGTLTKFKKR